MEIKFENERELIDAILRTDVNVHVFAMLFLDRLGIVLTNTVQKKLIDAQEKRSAERKEYDEWANVQKRVFTMEDVMAAHPTWGKDAPLVDAKDQLKRQVGYAKRGTIWYSDFRYYGGEHHFNEDGCRTVTYLLYAKDFYDKDTLDVMRKTLGISDAE